MKRILISVLILVFLVGISVALLYAPKLVSEFFIIAVILYLVWILAGTFLEK